jgi:hypothetical protein
MSNLQPIELNTDNGIVKFTLTPPDTSPKVRDALINNTAFPDDAFTGGKVIPLGSIGIAAEKDFKLDSVDFKLGARFLAGFGVYRSTEELFKTLKNEGLDEPMMEKLDFPDLDAQKLNLFALRWGYAAEAEVNGKLPNVAFGVGLTFGASGRVEGLYSVVRAFDRQAKAFDSISETVKSWKMPRQITAPEKLEPGTWVISETDGSLKLSLGVQYGYEYSWSRENIKTGVLSGDLALKIQAGIDAKFGFEASGRYALVVARESAARTLRLQVFKLKQKGWSFAFDAAVSAQATSVPLPENFHEFIKGIFNLNGLQALKDIKEKWLDPDANLAELLGAKLSADIIKLVEKVTGVTPANIKAAIDKLKSVFNRWHALPHEIASTLYDLLKKISPVDLAQLKAFLEEAVRLSNPGGVEADFKNFIAGHLDDFAFFETPIGKWLTAAANKGILSLLANFQKERAQFNDWAKKTLALLDGDLLEKTLKELQTWIEEKLGLDKIIKLINQADFDNLDDWLKKRLSDFLGKTVVFQDLEKIRDAIKKLLKMEKLKELYDKGYKALTDKYQAELHYTFQSTTTKTALIDLTFDFEANAANADRFLELGLKGDFAEVLSSKENIAGVRINQATLTHQIKRQSHLEVGLPFFKSSLDHLTDSTASGDIVQQDSGRLWVFSLDAKDVVKKKTSISKLSVAASLKKNAGVRVFSETEGKFSYQLRFIKQNADGEALRKRLKAVAEKYFPAEFSGAGDRTFDKYLAALDRALEEKGIKGEDNFGNVLAAFTLALPGEALTAWEKAPATTTPIDSKYFSISRRVQENLRNWIPLVYIHDLDQYDSLQTIYPLLVYTALPIIDKIRRSGNQITFTPGGALYDWDFADSLLRQGLMNSVCTQNLPPILARVRQVLKSKPGTQDRYRDTKINQMIQEAQKNDARRFVSLVKREEIIIKGVTKTAKAFNDFLAADKVDKAIEALATFGAEVSDTFNEDIGGLYSGETLRPLGSLLMLEIAGILDNTLIGKLKPAAMLELLVVKAQSQFALADFLENKRPEATDIALQQTIVSVG